jgi:hypothetical protein
MPFAAAIAGAAGIGSAIIGANASSDATKAQVNAANQNNALQTKIFDTTTANEAPFLAAGNNGLTALMQALGLAPGSSGGIPNGAITQPFTAQQYQKSPGYQFQFDQGVDAINNRASSQGGVQSGNTLKALTQYGQGVANQDYQQAYNNFTQNQGNLFSRLFNLAGTGQNAAANLGSAGQNYANALGANTNAIGNAQAAGSVAGGNTLANLLNNPSLQTAFQNMFGGGSGSSGGLNLPAGVPTTNFGTGSDPFYVPNFG